MVLKDQIVAAVEEKIQGTDIFLVEVKASHSKVAVYIDRPEGMNLEDCAGISRYLENRPELKEVFEKHALEVSSPGMDEPLRVLKQYEKRIGQDISVLMKDGIRMNGTLKSASHDELVIVESKKIKENGKKVFSTQEHRIPMDEIKETRVVFNFNKILH